jgi:hypothetical protein
MIGKDTLVTELKGIVEDAPKDLIPSLHLEGPTYVVLRRQGRLKQAFWCHLPTLKQLWQQILSEIALLSNASSRGPDTVELCFCYQYQRVPLKHFNSTFANMHRGIRGIEIQYRDQIVRYSPTRMIATNLSFQTIWQNFLDREALTLETFVRQGGQLYTFSSHQILIQLHPTLTLIPLHRGNQIFPLTAVSPAEIQTMITTMAGWLFRQIQLDGRLIYRYFPSRGEESNKNNAIRQFMATLCLIRYAQISQKPEHQLLAIHNLNYNLKRFYRKHEHLGLIEHEGKIKLGSLAIAALCLLESISLIPDSPEQASYSDILDSLCQTIEALWQPDGSFRTFWLPAERNDNQNFYPGEALLFWSKLHQVRGDTQILDRCYQSFGYYREWYRQHPNPAFIPWHTQAYAQLYLATHDQEFLDFVFQMNDDLLSLQQVAETIYLDLEGRFHNPDRAEWGPPHSSSTGVYLEGLVVALALAIQVGDQARVQRYHQAIWRGVRSLRQLQFRDLSDMFYISKPTSVQGGIRTTVYDNTIRIDNVQHGLMALMALQQLPSDPILNLSTHEFLSTLQRSSTPPLNSFRLINQNVDVLPLLAEIEAQANLWTQDTRRQEQIKVQQETQTIPLRRARRPFPQGVTQTRDVHASALTPWAKQFPLILGWIEAFVTDLGGELGRASIVRLAPYGRVHRHIDHGEYYRHRDRYHLILKSSCGSLLIAGEEWARMQPGEVWWFDNKVPHAAYNPSDQWRIHLIFDVLPGSVRSATEPDPEPAVLPTAQ